MLPNLAILLTAFTLVYAVFAYQAPTQLFRDADTGWHIRTGESILESGQVPKVDPYSFTRPGQPWFAWEWGADVVMALAHRLGGLAGVAILYWLVLGMVSWLWAELHRRAGGTFLVTALLSISFLTTTQLHWLARPHLFGWLFLLLALHAALRRAWWFAVPLALVWANFHGSFFLLPLLWGLYAVGNRDRAPLWPALAALAATVINPYGLALHQHLWAYLTNTELLSRIAEFQSFNFHAEGSLQVALVLTVCLAAATLALWTGRYAEGLWLLLLSAMALRSARSLPVAALAGLPLANAVFCRSVAVLQGPARAWGGRFLAYSERLATFDSKALGLPWLLLALFICLLPGGWKQGGPFRQAGFPTTEFPMRAIDEYLQKQAQPHWRLFAPDKFGGVLIYRLHPQLKVYFDGRSDFYGAPFLQEYIRLLEVRPGWQDLLRKEGFTHALVLRRYSLADALPRLGWQIRYQDADFILFEKN